MANHPTGPYTLGVVGNNSVSLPVLTVTIAY